MRMVILLFILHSAFALAEDPAPDNRAQLCTQINAFFQSTPQPNPELLREYLRGQSGGLLSLLPRNGNLTSLYRRFARAQRRPDFQQACTDIIPAPGSRNSRGQAQLNLIAFGAASSGEVLKLNTLGQRTADEVSSLSGQYCMELSTCRMMPPLEVESQGRTICNITQTAGAARASTTQSEKCQCLIDLQTLQCTPFDSASTTSGFRTAVLRSFGQNFLNSYAQLREDTKYYQTQAVRVTSMNRPEFNCSEFSGFQARVRSQCGNRPDLENRMQTVLNGFSNLNPGTASSMFAQTNEQIMRAPGPNGGITRSFVDYNRNALTLRPEIRGIEKMVQDCLIGDPFFGSSGWSSEPSIQRIGSPPAMPFQKIAKLLQRKAFENPDAFIARYVQREKFGDSYQAIVDYIRNPSNRDDEDQNSNIFLGRITQLMVGHPGFDMLLSNDDFARRATARAVNGNVRAWLETPGSGIDTRFRDECVSLQNEFASLVCASDQEMQRLIGTNDIQEVIDDNQDIEPALDLQSIDRLRCQTTGDANGYTAGIFEKIRNTPADSDYYNRFMSPAQTSVMGAIAENVETNNPDFYRNVQRGLANSGGSISAYDSQNDPMASSIFENHPELAGGSDGVDRVRQQPSLEESVARRTEASERTQEDPSKVNPNDPNSTQRQAQAAGIAPVILPSSSTATTDGDARRALRENLGSGESQDTVNRLVSNLDDDMAGQLAELRQQLAQNQQQNQQRGIDELNARADRLQRQLRDSEQERTRLQDQVDSGIRNQNSAALNRQPASVPTRDDRDFSSGRDQLPRSASTTSGQNSGSSGQPSGSTTLPSDSGQAGLAPVRGGSSASRASSVSAGGITVARYEPAASGGPVTVEAQSGTTVASGSGSEDLTRNIRQYLEQNNLDLETLIQIKESGMLYRYRVTESGQSVQREMLVSYANLDENLRNLIDQKILSSRATPAQIERISSDLRLRKRNYSYETLRAIIVGSANGTL